MDREPAIEQARAAQRVAIFARMLARYIGGRRKIEKWDDFRFSLAFFYTWTGANQVSTAARRRAFDKLASEGVIERWQTRPGDPIRYRFPREFCDTIAAEAVAHYEAMGYSQDEMRSEVQHAGAPDPVLWRHGARDS